MNYAFSPPITASDICVWTCGTCLFEYWWGLNSKPPKNNPMTCYAAPVTSVGYSRSSVDSTCRWLMLYSRRTCSPYKQLSETELRCLTVFINITCHHPACFEALCRVLKSLKRFKIYFMIRSIKGMMQSMTLFDDPHVWPLLTSLVKFRKLVQNV